MYKVLIVEDDDVQRQQVKEILSGFEFSLYEAKDGLEALKIIASEKPNLIFLDIQMPRMNGWELCRYIKSRKDFAQVHIIFLTSLRDIQDMLEARKVGADDYIVKPITPEKIRDCLGRANVLTV